MLTLRAVAELSFANVIRNGSGYFESWNAVVSRSCQAAPEQAVGADRQSASLLKIRIIGGRSTAALDARKLVKYNASLCRQSYDIERIASTFIAMSRTNRRMFMLIAIIYRLSFG